MIYKLQTNCGASYTIRAEDIAAIEFPSPEQLKEMGAKTIPDPLSPIRVHMHYGACFPSVYGQAEEIMKFMEMWDAKPEWLSPQQTQVS